MEVMEIEERWVPNLNGKGLDSWTRTLNYNYTLINIPLVGENLRQFLTLPTGKTKLSRGGWRNASFANRSRLHGLCWYALCFSMKYVLVRNLLALNATFAVNHTLKQCPTVQMIHLKMSYSQCSTNNVLRALKRNKLRSLCRRLLKIRNGRCGPMITRPEYKSKSHVFFCHCLPLWMLAGQIPPGNGNVIKYSEGLQVPTELMLESRIQGCNTGYTHYWFQTFRRNVQPSSLTVKKYPHLLLNRRLFVI